MSHQNETKPICWMSFFLQVLSISRIYLHTYSSSIPGKQRNLQLNIDGYKHLSTVTEIDVTYKTIKNDFKN